MRLTSDETQVINQLNRKGNIFVSSIIFWEIALLAEKNKLDRDIKGFTESEWSGLEIYVQDVGLVYYKKIISEEFIIEYSLSEIMTFEDFRTLYGIEFH